MTENHREAQLAALAARDQYTPQATGLISYQSNGRVIVIGDEAGWKGFQNLPEPLQSFAVITAYQDRAVIADSHVVPLGSRRIEISGHLGDFHLRLIDSLGQHETLHGDMVLDLSQPALIERDMLPPGYLHVDSSQLETHAVQQQLLDMVGQFDKPRYFRYDSSICAHGVNGNPVCTKCIDACPAEAISSIGEMIDVDPFLCQGGGACATVCPSGAIGYAYPSLADQGNRLRIMLREFRRLAEGEAPIVLFHADTVNADSHSQTSANLLPIPVEEIASVGMDLCLSALAYGAARVVLDIDRDEPAMARDTLHRELSWVRALLEGLDIDPTRIGFLHEQVAPLTGDIIKGFQSAEYSMPNNKRQALFQAVDHLYQQAEISRELTALPVGAPLGMAIIDADSCTLCMACVGACPGKALQDGANREMPEVLFVESHCLQCGACVTTCPEQAVRIEPRIVFDREQRNRLRTLNQDTPFACVQCGKPFAPTSVIHKMGVSLQDHYMFKTERARDRLKMCEDCRVADIVQDPDAMNGNFDPLGAKSSKRIS